MLAARLAGKRLVRAHVQSIARDYDGKGFVVVLAWEASGGVDAPALRSESSYVVKRLPAWAFVGRRVFKIFD